MQCPPTSPGRNGIKFHFEDAAFTSAEADVSRFASAGLSAERIATSAFLGKYIKAAIKQTNPCRRSVQPNGILPMKNRRSPANCDGQYWYFVLPFYAPLSVPPHLVSTTDSPLAMPPQSLPAVSANSADEAQMWSVPSIINSPGLAKRH